MQPEHLVLCGGLQGSGVSGAKAHRLSLTEPARNIVLRITDIRRTLVTNLPDVLTDLLHGGRMPRRRHRTGHRLRRPAR